MLKTWRSLRKMGIVGINQRNVDFVLKYNRRKHYPVADDKLRLKKLAEEHGLAVPELYGVIDSVGQLHDFQEFITPFEDFVIKPSRGCGGEGILVITNHDGKIFQRAREDTATLSEVRHHITNILYGLYSLGGRPDKAMIEYRVNFDPVFAPISFRGVPDIRIIVFHGVPVMAMVRLPTEMSRGKANLHQGAIGVGIDISTGRTLHGVQVNSIIDHHPDTGNSIYDLPIPKWDELLTLASRCSGITGLQYLGIDIVLDRNLGPLILELNARPGLNIQIANQEGLEHRLRIVEKNYKKFDSIEQRVLFGKEQFVPIH